MAIWTSEDPPWGFSSSAVGEKLLFSSGIAKVWSVSLVLPVMTMFVFITGA